MLNNLFELILKVFIVMIFLRFFVLSITVFKIIDKHESCCDCMALSEDTCLDEPDEPINK